MTTALDIQDAALVNLRFDKVIFLSNKGKRGKNIERCNCLRCPLDTDNLLSDFIPDICKQFIFQRIQAVLRAEDQIFEFFEFLCDIALGIGQCLLADIIIRNLVFG